MLTDSNGNYVCNLENVYHISEYLKSVYESVNYVEAKPNNLLLGIFVCLSYFDDDIGFEFNYYFLIKK